MEVLMIYLPTYVIKSVYDIDFAKLYAEGKVGERLGGILQPVDPKFVHIPDGPMVSPLKPTNNLMNKIYFQKIVLML